MSRGLGDLFSCADPGKAVPMASVGLLPDGDLRIAYGRQYQQRQDAFSIDPLHLPLGPGELRLPRTPEDPHGTYGALSDAGPNAWGVRLTASICRATGQPVPATPLDWLVHSWHFGAGCLGFSAHHTQLPEQRLVADSVSVLSARIVCALEAVSTTPDPILDEEAIRLALPGASLGGVRPKTVVLQEGRECIAKFSRLDDRFDVPACEYATMRLAHMAGIDVPDFEHVEIGGRSVLLVKRFDRIEDGRRVHFLSAHTLLGMGRVRENDYAARYSYGGIAECLALIDDEAVADSHQLFRRMVFNILVGNVDDHLRNHAVLMHERDRYRLSPAFDLVPHLDAAVMPQSIGVGTYGRASTIENAMSQHARFKLLKAEAARIVEEVRDVVAGWRGVFRESGVARQDILLLASCFGSADSAPGG